MIDAMLYVMVAIVVGQQAGSGIGAFAFYRDHPVFQSPWKRLYAILPLAGALVFTARGLTTIL